MQLGAWSSCVAYTERIIRPVISPNNAYIQPNYWLTEYDRFTSAATFAIFEVSINTAVKTFGKLANTYKVDYYTVLVWKRNITQELKSPFWIGRPALPQTLGVKNGWRWICLNG